MISRKKRDRLDSNLPAWLLALLFFGGCSLGCSAAVLGDAVTGCYEAQMMLERAAAKCPAGTFKPKTNCEYVIWFDMHDYAGCEAKLDMMTCTQKADTTNYPDDCTVDIIETPF